MERPLLQDMDVWSDVGLHEELDVEIDGLPQDFATWTGFEFVAGELKAANPLLTGGVQVLDRGKLFLAIEPAALAGIFSAADGKVCKDYPYVLRVKPGTEYKVRLMYGKLTIHRGLP
jgi:hypothetical protein